MNYSKKSTKNTSLPPIPSQNYFGIAAALKEIYNKDPSPPPQPPPPPPPTQPTNLCNDTLLKKYTLGENGIYHSNTTGSMFENMISYVPGGCFKALEIWKLDTFAPIRAIDDRLRKEYRKSSGGHSGYTFHSLTKDEIKLFDKCLFSAINNMSN